MDGDDALSKEQAVDWFSSFFVGLVVVVFGLAAVVFVSVAFVVLAEALVLGYRALKLKLR